MKCENLQFNLSIYMDDCLTADERALVDGHLSECALCRQKLADFQELRKSLLAVSRPVIPNHVLNQVRSTVAGKLNTTGIKPLFLFPSDSRGWLRAYLMPSGVGVVASLLLGFFVLGFLLSGANVQRDAEIASLFPKYSQTVVLTNPPSNTKLPFEFESADYAINPKDFADARISVSGESPSVNPTGALVALSRSIVRGEMKDEEVVVVADVFGNGLAQIAEVIEAPQDAQTLYDLDKALKTDPDYAPFVPATMDNRADSVQIVLKIRRVDVNVNNFKSKNKR